MMVGRLNYPSQINANTFALAPSLAEADAILASAEVEVESELVLA